MSSIPYYYTHRISRRTVVKGLVGVTMMLSTAGCTSSNPTSVATATKTLAHLTPGAAISSPAASPTAGTTLYTFMGHSGPVNGVAWSPDGKRIASASFDGTTQVFDATTGKHILTYNGQSEGLVYAVAWSPDGTRIVSGGEDKTAQVWSASSGDRLLTYKGHANRVNTVAWSPDSTRVASGSGGELTFTSSDNTVQVWEAG